MDAEGHSDGVTEFPASLTAKKSQHQEEVHGLRAEVAALQAALAAQRQVAEKEADLFRQQLIEAAAESQQLKEAADRMAAELATGREAALADALKASADIDRLKADKVRLLRREEALQQAAEQAAAREKAAARELSDMASAARAREGKQAAQLEDYEVTVLKLNIALEQAKDAEEVAATQCELLQVRAPAGIKESAVTLLTLK